jgi:Tol biopolymer transport system component
MATEVTELVPSLTGLGQTDAGNGGGELACRPQITDTTIIDDVAGGYPFGNPQISDDGSAIVFASPRALIPESETGDELDEDIFIYDVNNASIERVTPGESGRLDHFCPCSISADGQVVVFGSKRADLISGELDSNGDVRDIFAFDRRIGLIERVTPGLGDGGVMSIGTSLGTQRALSGDGSLVVFEARANGLIPGELPRSDNRPDLMLFNRTTQLLTRLTPSHIDGSVNSPTISGDGRFVAFNSSATNLISGQITAAASTAYRLDLTTNAIDRIARPVGILVRPNLSNDGSVLVADGQPSNELGSTNQYHVFAANFDDPSSLAAIDVTEPPENWNIDPFISGNGQFITFRQVSGQVPVEPGEIVLVDRANNAHTRIGQTFARSPSLSGDGSRLVYRGQDGGTSGIAISEVEYPCAN